MSIDEAKRFIDNMKSDTDLVKEASGVSSMDAVLDFAKKHGYDVSQTDLIKASETIELSIEACDDELSDASLEKVAGGKKQFFASGEQVGGFLSF